MKFRYISISLIAISVLILLLFALNPTSLGLVGTFLGWAYILLGIAVIAAVGLPLVYLFQNPEKLKKTGIYVGAIVIVVLFASVFSSSDPIIGANFTTEPAPGTLRWTETGLISTYILLAAAFITVIVGGINSMRNR
jgi:hypothetical protein